MSNETYCSTYLYAAMGKPREKNLGLQVDLTLRGWYSLLNNIRRAEPDVQKHNPERWVLFAMPLFLKSILERFPRTPSKVLTSILVLLYVSFFRTWPRSIDLKNLFFLVKKQKGEYTAIMSGRKKSSKRLSKELKTSSVAESDISQVFEYWIEICKNSSRRRPVLDEKRKIAIGAAIHDYGVEQCKNAIMGCTLSDFHMGRNKANKRYDDVELILRDSRHVEQFLEMYDRAYGGGKEPW